MDKVQFNNLNERDPLTSETKYSKGDKSIIYSKFHNGSYL